MTTSARGAARPRYRWTILAVGAGTQGALSALQQGLPALGPALRDEFALSLSGVGLLLAGLSWGIMATTLLWGWLADRIGERTVISAGLGGGSVALVGAALAPSAAWLFVALVAAGTLAGSAAAASGRAVIGWFGRSERGTALGIRQMAVPLGGAAAAVSLPALVALGGLRAAFLALAAAAAAGALAAAGWLREPPPAPAGRPPVTAPAPLRDRRMWRLSIGSALLVTAQVAIVTFVVLFLHDERGVAVAWAAGALAAIQLGGAVARVVAGRRSDVSRPPGRAHATPALATAAGLMVTAALTDGPLAVLVGALVVTAVLSMSWNGLSFTAAAELAGRERAGTALGCSRR